jgi:N-acetylglucosaminyldiphosphoundecaprenol N-acetyl-beta-D-mannosaminyltransferase
VPLPEISTRPVLGIDVAVIDYQGSMDFMDAMVAGQHRGYVCAVPVHAVMVAQADDVMADAIAGATLIVPDGMPLVWAMNMMGERLSDRVYGPELMQRYCQRSAEKGHRVWLYGGRDQGSLLQLAQNLRRRYPNLKIAGGYAPPFRSLTDDEEDEIAEMINAAKPDVVWCGIGVPKQEKWMARMRPKVEAPVLVGVGAAFDFIAGRVSQAPRWMQERGLEWTYRIAQEPARLLPRYVFYNPQFVVAFARQHAQMRRRARA